MKQKFILELSEEDSKTFLILLEQAKQLLNQSVTVQSVAQDSKPESPLKRSDILLEFNLKGSTFYNLQRRGIITPHRMEGSRLTYYYRSDVLAALKKFNPGKYAR